MTINETPQQAAERIVHDIRVVASQLTFVERVGLLRDATAEIRTALSEDVTSRSVNAPQGREWEFEGLDPILEAANRAYVRARGEQQ